MKLIKSTSFQSVAGFRTAGVSAGIKYKDRKDLALIVSDFPASIAGTFTTNRVKAAPVLVCKKNLRAGRASALVVNSGCANACTGQKGMADALEMARTCALSLGVSERTVFVCSTGTIGTFLPMNKIKAGVTLAASCLSKESWPDAASAIMTTDTKPKMARRNLKIDGRSITVAGIAKGSGMIAPDMATMLAFIVTDANAAPAQLRACLLPAVRNSFNRITVDGDTSTNDTVLLMANGAAGGAQLRTGSRAWKLFCDAVEGVAKDLALQIVRDGEGATKLVSVVVKGAPNEKAAEKAARAVASSLLVKTSWYGADPNWGRVIGALGYSGVPLDPDKVDISFNDRLVVRNGQAARANEAALRKILSAPAFSISIDLKLGRASSVIYSCDCSEEYVKINASYMT